MLNFKSEIMRNFNEIMRNFNLRMESFLNRFTINTKYGALAAIATAIIMGAGTYIACRYAKRALCGGKNAEVFRRSMSIGALRGGKLAMERLTDYDHARIDAASLNEVETELRALLAEEQPDLNRLQRTVAKLEMGGKEAVAVKILEAEVEKAKMDKKPHEAYEIEMLLVEMLIYKGDCEKALTCECLTHQEISDARRPLYKAIIHIMLDHPKKEALECWEEFAEVWTQFQSLPSSKDSQQPKIITNFREFEKVVNKLKKDINKACSPQRLQSSNKR